MYDPDLHTWGEDTERLERDAEVDAEPTFDFTFTISATFEAATQQDAWDEWVEWLTEPMHIEDGTDVTKAGPVPYEFPT